MSAQQIETKARQVLASQSVDSLIMSLEVLEIQIAELRKAETFDDLPNRNHARLWVIEELERRYPEVKDIDLDYADERTYAEWLIDTVNEIREVN